MAKWDYMFLEIKGHNAPLIEAGNMLVTTSDGRCESEKMPTNIIGVVRRLCEEGWEMVNSSGGGDANGNVGVLPGGSFEAVFKRPQ